MVVLCVCPQKWNDFQWENGQVNIYHNFGNAKAYCSKHNNMQRAENARKRTFSNQILHRIAQMYINLICKRWRSESWFPKDIVKSKLDCSWFVDDKWKVDVPYVCVSEWVFWFFGCKMGNDDGVILLWGHRMQLISHWIYCICTV